MPDTLQTIAIGDEWVSANALTGIEVGIGLVIQNQGATQLVYAASPTQPDAGFIGVIIPPRLDRPLMTSDGESEAWLRARFPGTTGRANIQEG